MSAFDPSVLRKIWRINELKANITALTEEAAALRREVAPILTPGLGEGTKTVKLPEEWKVKVGHKINRTIDQAVLTAISEPCLQAGIELKSLVTYSPKLVVKAYRDLTAEQRVLFGECVIERPGLPEIELIAPTPKE